jgi:hypothetical protein
MDRLAAVHLLLLQPFKHLPLLCICGTTKVIIFTKSIGNVSELHSNNITDSGSGSGRNARNVKTSQFGQASRHTDKFVSIFGSSQVECL